MDIFYFIWVYFVVFVFKFKLKMMYVEESKKLNVECMNDEIKNLVWFIG